MTGLDIKVLGPGCANCQMLEQRTFQALAEIKGWVKKELGQSA